MGKKIKSKYKVEITVQEVSSIPLLIGSLFVKVRLRNRSHADGVFINRTPSLPIKEYGVKWNHTFRFTCKISKTLSESKYDIEDCWCRISLRMETKGGSDCDKIGYIDINLSNHIDKVSAEPEARYILEEYNKEKFRGLNSLLDISLRVTSDDPSPPSYDLSSTSGGGRVPEGASAAGAHTNEAFDGSHLETEPLSEKIHHKRNDSSGSRIISASASCDRLSAAASPTVSGHSRNISWSFGAFDLGGSTHSLDDISTNIRHQKQRSDDWAMPENDGRRGVDDVVAEVLEEHRDELREFLKHPAERDEVQFDPVSRIILDDDIDCTESDSGVRLTFITTGSGERAINMDGVIYDMEDAYYDAVG